MCSVSVCLCFFFFKQKTAYELRISDWSSDVCSSDLLAWPVLLLAALAFPAIASAQSGDHVTLGAGAGVVPDYQRSDDYRFLPIPVIDAQFGQFFVSLRNGIGVNVIEIGPLTAGASVALVGGYRRRDVPDGVRRVSTTAGGRLFANLKLDKLSFTVGATKAVAGGTRGVVADAS